MKQVKGNLLRASVRQDCLRRFVHRFTRDHVPAWSKKQWKDGQPYPLQFNSDDDWLRNTLFWITDAGELSNRHSYCASSPTWPDNPELRSKQAKLTD